MSDYISRQAAIDGFYEMAADTDHLCTVNDYVGFLENMSSAPVREVKRGRWRHYEGYLTCSECRTEYDDDIMTHCCDDVPKFCPNCGSYNGDDGADMREES